MGPIVRILPIASVAVALVKLALFPDGAAKNHTAQATGQIVEPQVPVALGTITNDLTLPGTVNAALKSRDAVRSSSAWRSRGHSPTHPAC